MFRRSIPVLLSVFLILGAPLTVDACSGSLHVEVQQSGVYALDYAAIVEQQPGLRDCRSDELILRHRDQEIALRVSGDHDGRFDAGARIEWVGEMLHGPASWFDPFSLANTYILSTATGTRARLRETTSVGAGVATALSRQIHLEQENMMIRLNQRLVKPGEEPDVMQWAKLTHADPQPFSFEFDLPDLDIQASARRGDSIAASIDFRGMSDVPAPTGATRVDDHAVELRINGIALPLLTWNGHDEVRREIRLPLATLKAHGNTLSLHVPVRHAPWDGKNPVVDVIMYNWIELTYPIAGNVDASDAPFLRAAGNAGTSLELTHIGDQPISLYSTDGQYQLGVASANHYRFAANAPDTEIFPVIGTNFLKPTLLRAVNDSALHSAAPGYDYLIIAHRSLIDAIKPLAELHRQRGLKVAVLNVDSVYDEFNGGIEHPQAIRELVGWGSAHWQIKPRYVLLVGDASFDIRHNQPNDLNYAKWATQPHELQYPGHFDAIPGTPYADTPKDLATRNLIPTWQFPSEEGQSASDNAYVTLKTGDFHPSIAIGRFPVVTPEEVSAIVKKTIAYLTQPELGPWRHNTMFIADETEYFQSSSNQIADELDKQGFVTEKVYAKSSEADNLAHQNEIRDSINQGDLLVHFIGHGGRFIWRTGPPDLHKNHDLFTLDDVSGLKNPGRLPMILSMTCYSAPFDNPTEDSIGERFLREPDKGAVAVFAASWRNSPYPEYSKSLIAELLTPGQTIGDAIVAAKAKLRDRTLVETYNLLGDPALVLKRPQQKIDLVRETGRWQTRVAVRLPQPDFSGKVTVNWIDANGATLFSHNYQSEDSQFVLDAPAVDAANVQIYAADLRSGTDGIGALDLRPPPPKKIVLPATVVALASPPSRSAPTVAPTTAVAPAKSRMPDQIARFDFDGGKTPTKPVTAAKVLPDTKPPTARAPSSTH